jgi:hypothetical protein
MKRTIKDVDRSWRQDGERWKAYFRYFLNTIGGFISVFVIPLLIMSLWVAGEGSPHKAYFLCFVAVGIIPPFTCSVAMAAATISTERLQSEAEFFSKLDPFRVYFWLLPKFTLFGLPLAIRWVWRERVNIRRKTRDLAADAVRGTRNLLKRCFLLSCLRGRSL